MQYIIPVERKIVSGRPTNLDVLHKADKVPSLFSKTIQYTLVVRKSDLKTEVAQGFGALKSALAKDGYGLQNIVKMEIQLSGLKERFAEFNPLYAAEFDGHAPTRVCVEPTMDSDASIVLKATVVARSIEIVKAGPAGAPYSAAVKAGNTLYVSGQIKPGEPDFDKQVDAVLGSIKAIAEEAGANVKNAKNIVVYVGEERLFKFSSHFRLQHEGMPFNGAYFKMKALFGKRFELARVVTKALPAGVDFEVACNFRLS